MTAFVFSLPVASQARYIVHDACQSRCRVAKLARTSLKGRQYAHCCVESPSSYNGKRLPSDEKGEALVRAAMVGDALSIDHLLTDGVSANYASVQGESLMTPLMWAAAEGYSDIATKLINAGADVNAKASQGSTPLLFALENMPSANPREAPPAGFPGRVDKPQPSQIPIIARLTGHIDIIRLLVARGADIRTRNAFDETALHLAARKAQDGLVREFLVRGIDINSRSRGFQETALHIAAKENHARVVDLLCDLGANIEARSRFGWTPLLWAAASGWEDVVRALIEKGADVNTKAGEGSNMTTPLKEARRCSRPQSVSKLLIRAGAIE